MIDIDKIVKGFTGELKISAKCEGSNVMQKIEYKNGNRACMVYILCSIINNMYNEDALDKDDIQLIHIQKQHFHLYLPFLLI